MTLRAADVRAAINRLLDPVPPVRDLGPFHPGDLDRACDLLGLPRGTPLTRDEMWQAATAELDALPPDQRDTAVAAIMRLVMHRG